MIDSGTTSFCNINPWYKPVVRAVRKTGMRAKLALSLKDVGTPYKPKVSENAALVKRYRSGLVEGMFGLANEKECSTELIARVSELAKRYDSGIHVHVAESPLGEQMIERKYGKTSIQYMDSLGALNEKTIAVHCVNISDRDVSVLRRSGASVVHCPTTNLLVHVGISPVRRLLAGGVGVNLGTDEPVANPTMDVRREAVMAKKLHHLPTETIFKMLTDGRLFGSAVGEIAVGKRADLVVSEARSLEELVFGRAETTATMVDGNILKG
jgi:5-methylthioadenosine/S-adenosylhomocysteine deaminase